MDPLPGARPVPANRTRYPFNLRLEHSLLPDYFEGKAPKGPFEVTKFTYRDIDYVDHLSAWTPPYLDDLRKLALQFWMGSEFDIAVIQRARNPNAAVALTKIVTVFDERVDQTIQLVSGATWDEAGYCYHHDKKTNYIQLVSYLLTYLNAVFLDDTIDGVSRVYFQNPLSNPPGDSVRISRGDGVKTLYRKGDYWNSFHEVFYSPKQMG